MRLFRHESPTPENSRIPTNSLVIDGVFFGVSPALKVFALNAETGEGRLHRLGAAGLKLVAAPGWGSLTRTH